MPKLDLSVVTDPGAFARLSPEWDALAARAGDRAMFQTSDWILRAWERHRPDRARSMHVVCARAGSELVLGAPFVRIRDWFGASTLAFLDSRTPIYNDILTASDGRAGAARAALWRHLGRSWSVRAVKLTGIREDSHVHADLAGRSATRTWTTSAPFLELAGYADEAAFFARRSSNFRYQLRRAWRRLAAGGAVRFIRRRTPEEMAPAIAWLFARKRAWLATRPGIDPWIGEPGVEAFFQGIAAVEAARSQGEVVCLEVGDRLVAATLVFRRGETWFLSKLGYDPSFERASPGWALTVHIVGLAIAAGAERIDFMIGADIWKERLTGGSVAVGNYRLPNGPGRWLARFRARS